MSGPDQIRIAAAEAAGTFILVFGVLGAALLSEPFDDAGPNPFTIAVALGLAAAAAGVLFGDASGGHFNPAVSIAVTVSGRSPWRLLPLYIGSQVAGAIIAATAIALIIDGRRGGLVEAEVGGFAATGWGPLSPNDFSFVAAFLTELIATGVLAAVVLVVSRWPRNLLLAPLTVGGTLTLLALVAIPVSNGSFNPARSVASALYGGTEALTQLWMSVTAPVLGAAVVGIIVRLVARPARRRSSWQASTVTSSMRPVPAFRGAER